MTMPHTSSRSRTRRWSNERGSILIPTAIALLGLLAFSSFTIDNGQEDHYPAEIVCTRDAALEALGQFYETGALPDNVRWFEESDD